MENSIINFLQNYDLKYNLSHTYINDIFLDIKQYLLFMNYKRYNLTKKKIIYYIYKYFNQNLSIIQSVINISKIKQPEQRTPEWYAIRYNIISASDASSILGKNIKFISDIEYPKILFKNGFKSKKDLIKVKILQQDNFTGNVYTEHGIIFEEVANLIYQKRNNTNVIDFGLVIHPKIKFIGASPDGITQDGIMLEIKCPYKRNLTNQIPSNYWVQMQLQLECCNLDICHFVEIKVQFYNNSQEYYNDILSSDTLYTSDNLEKGILLKYLDEHNKNIYIYPSYNDYKNYNTLESWAKNTFNYYSTKYNTIEFKYWKITQYSLIEVNRDINWFQKTLPIFKQFWDKILYYKNNLNHFYKDIINNNKKSKTKTKTNIDNSSKLLISDSDDDNTTHTNNTSTLNNLLQPSNTNLDNSSKLLISDSDDDTENSSTLNNLLLPSNTNIDNSSKLLISDSDDDDTENTSTLNNLLLLSNTNKKNIQKNIKKNIIKQKSINKTTLINNNISTFSEISLKNTSSLITTPNNNINVNEIIDDLL